MIRHFLKWLRPTALAPAPQPEVWARPKTDAMVSLDEDVLVHINQTGTCPYCFGKLYGGPRGGASVNMFCERVDTCDSRFNVVDPEFGFVPIGQFTGPTPNDFKAYIRGQRQ